MPFYRISFVREGRLHTGIRESEMDLAEMYQDYEMRLNHRYGWGTIKQYSCVQLYEKSSEVVAFLEGKGKGAE